MLFLLLYFHNCHCICYVFLFANFTRMQICVHPNQHQSYMFITPKTTIIDKIICSLYLNIAKNILPAVCWYSNSNHRLFNSIYFNAIQLRLLNFCGKENAGKRRANNCSILNELLNDAQTTCSSFFRQWKR